MLNGVLQPPGFQATCCADETLQPGDHFAVAFSGSTLNSYYQREAAGRGPSWSPPRWRRCWT